MGTDRDTTTEVDGDDVHVLILATEVFGQLASNDLLVQGMEDRDAWEQRVTRVASHLVHFIDHDRVGDISLHSDFLGDVVGDEATKVGGMFAVVAFHEVLNHEIVHFVDTRDERTEQTATTHDASHFAQVDASFFQLTLDGFGAEGLLVGDVFVFRDFLSAVLEVLLEDLFLTFEHGDLGRGGTWIYR